MYKLLNQLIIAISYVRMSDTLYLTLFVTIHIILESASSWNFLKYYCIYNIVNHKRDKCGEREYYLFSLCDKLSEKYKMKMLQNNLNSFIFSARNTFLF